MCETSQMRFNPSSPIATPLAFWPSWPRDRNSLASGLVGQESSASLGTLLMDSFEKCEARGSAEHVWSRGDMPHMPWRRTRYVPEGKPDESWAFWFICKSKVYCHGMSRAQDVQLFYSAWVCRLWQLHTPVNIHGSEISFQSWTRDSVENWWLTVVFMTLYCLTSGHWNAPFLLCRWLGIRACGIANVMCVSALMNKSFCCTIPTWIGWWRNRPDPLQMPIPSWPKSCLDGHCVSQRFIFHSCRMPCSQLSRAAITLRLSLA